PYTPAARHILLHQPLRHSRGALGARDPRPQAVAGIRYDRANRLLAGIQPKAVCAFFFHPEHVLASLLQLLGLLAQRTSALTSAKRLEDLGHAPLGIVDIALELAERDRRRSPVAGGIDYSIARVLPALVLQSLRRASQVFLKAIAIH